MPTAPMCMGSLPKSASTGQALLLSGWVSDPTMISRAPLEASGCDPSTGASTYSAPAAFILSAMSQLSFGPAGKLVTTAERYFACKHGIAAQ